MAYPQNSNLEWFSTTKSPFFNGMGFNNWKTHMDCYLKSVDYYIQYIVMHGDIIPRKKIGDIFVDEVHEELDVKTRSCCLKILRLKTF